jgi:cytochrome P450
MTKIISEVEMPRTKTTLLPSDLTKYQQVEENLKIAKESWIASFGYGYVLYNQEDIRKILTDKRWHNALRFYAATNTTGDVVEDEYYKKRRSNILINLEGDDHARLRKLVAPSFSAKNVAYLKPFINWISNAIIDQLLEKNNFDIQKEFFHNIPVYVLCQLTGLPVKDIEVFNAWTEAAFKSFGVNDAEEVKKIRKEQQVIDEYVLKLIEERRANPQNDLITQLIQAEDSGDKLTSQEVVTLIEVIMSSGIDTTRCQLGLCLSYFANNPDKWEEAISSEESMNRLLEEAMAFDGTIRNVGRFASEDIVYKDILFPKGTLVVAALNISNINESENKPLSFGLGIHHCLGTALARLEIQEVFSVLAKRMPSFSIKSIEHKETTDVIWGLKSLVVEIK